MRDETNNWSHVGARGELAVCIQALKLGYLVFRSVTSTGLVDLVLYRGREAKTVQVKTITKDRTEWHEVEAQFRKFRKRKRKYPPIPWYSHRQPVKEYVDECDWLIYWYEDTDRFLLVKLASLHKNRLSSVVMKYSKWWM